MLISLYTNYLSFFSDLVIWPWSPISSVYSPIPLYSLFICLFLLFILFSKSFMYAYVSSTTFSGFFWFKIQHHSFKAEGPTPEKIWYLEVITVLTGRRLYRSGNWTFKVLSLEDTFLDLLAVWDPFLGYPTLYALYAASMGSLKARPTLGFRSIGQGYWFSSPMVNCPDVLKLVQLYELLYVNWLISVFLINQSSCFGLSLILQGGGQAAVLGCFMVSNILTTALQGLGITQLFLQQWPLCAL